MCIQKLPAHSQTPDGVEGFQAGCVVGGVSGSAAISNCKFPEQLMV